MPYKKTKLRKAVWLERDGYFGEPQKFPPIRFIVKQTMNTINPAVGDYITCERAQALLDEGYEVEVR